MLVVTALLALLTLVTLVIAFWRERHPVWERYERGYREAMAERLADLPQDRREAVLAGLPRGPIQDYIEAVRVVDRCRTCHRGIEESRMADAPQPYRAHPGDALRYHPASAFGCSVCHGGQGPSLAGVEAAHGRIEHWDEPLLPARYLEASCGRCHRNAYLPAQEVLDLGRAVERRECSECHDAGSNGQEALPLRHVGVSRGRRWLAGYLEEPGSVHAEYWSAGSVSRDEFDALVDELATRKGAEKLLRGKLLYGARGCGGCHQIDGVGGVLGIDLTEEGLRVRRQLDFSRLAGELDVVRWQEAHLLKPGAVMPDTYMIDSKLRSDEVELLVTYTLSLYPRWNYEAWRALDHDGFREEAYKADVTYGRALYGRYCAACHGVEGQGRIDIVHEGYAPALFNPVFLALADRDFLVYNVAQGREERNMPAWRRTAGLSDVDIDSIALFLASLPRIEAPRYPGPFRGSADRGKRIYEVQCAGCHGERGEGSVGPALALPSVQVASDEYLYATIALGRPGTVMLPYDFPGGTGIPSEGIADTVAYLRSLPERME